MHVIKRPPGRPKGSKNSAPRKPPRIVKREYRANMNALDDTVMERLEEVRREKHAAHQTAMAYQPEHDTDEHGNAISDRPYWGSKIEARMNQTLHRLTGGRWTWQGDEITRIKRATP